MNRIDQQVIHWLSLIAHRNVHVDHAISFISGSLLFKGAWVIAILWYYWFSRRGEEEARHNRIVIIASLVASCVAVIIAKAIGRFGPFRLRPMYEVWFKTPFGITPEDRMGLKPLNAFPSDHAAIFFGLIAGLFFLSWRMALLATLGVVALILFPRVYLGFHYPTDVIAGAALGMLCSLIAIPIFLHARPLGRGCDWLFAWKNRNPPLFYSLAFLVMVEYATLFEDVRHILHLP